MLVRIRKEDIIEGVIKATNTIPAKTGTAYLRIMWITASNDELCIFSTDSSMEFTGRYAASVSQGGIVGVQGKKFCELMRRMPPGEIVIKLDAQGKNLHVEQGRKKYKLPTNEVSWFQEFHRFPEEDTVTWSGDVFRDTIDRIAYCISDEEEQASMNCIKFTPVDAEDVEVCGLNGHLLGVVRFTDAELHRLLGEDGFLIAKKYLLEIRRWLDDGDLHMGLSEKRLFLRNAIGTEMLSIPLKTHTFADYRSFINQHSGRFSAVLEIDKHELIDALERSILFNTLSNTATFFDFSPNELSMYAQGQDIGEGTELIACTYSGSLSKVAMPTKNALEIITHFVSDRLTFSFINETEPCRITGKDDPQYVVYTMPVEVADDVYYTEVSI